MPRKVPMKISKVLRFAYVNINLLIQVTYLESLNARACIFGISNVRIHIKVARQSFSVSRAASRIKEIKLKLFAVSQ